MIATDDAGSPQANTPFDAIVDDALRQVEAAASRTPPLPIVIGPYHILEELGSGGMGVVYVAEQPHTRRRVALKVMRPERMSEHRRQCFRDEVEYLARLDHVGIAQVYEAGTFESPDGPLPYCAMELIDGESIIGYVTRTGIGPRERLALIAKLCDAVQHAHQNRIVHQDLKPSNVLVVGDDDSNTARVKVVDFGVAMLLDAESDAGDGKTHRMGTIEYMSPEQVSDDGPAVDTRTDVYAIGVIAYKVLTGKMPYAVDFEMTTTEVYRAVREDPPAPLGAHDRSLRGDVTQIIEKALAKDPEQRYQSASEMAADIRRFLRQEPIQARPASMPYLLRRFAQRHAAVVALVAAVIVVALAGLMMSSAARGRYVGARDSARSAATLLRGFLHENRTPTRQELAAAIAWHEQAESLLTPLDEAQIQEGIGQGYAFHGELESARVAYLRSIELTAEHASDPAFRYLRRLDVVTNFLVDAGYLDEADRMLHEGQAIIAADELAPLGAASDDELSRHLRHVNLAILDGQIMRARGELDDAATTLETAYARYATVVAETSSRPAYGGGMLRDPAAHHKLVSIRHLQATIALEQGRIEQAIEWLEGLRAIVLDSESGPFMRLQLTVDLAAAHLARGDVAQAGRLLLDASDPVDELLVQGHPLLLHYRNLRGRVMLARGDAEAAEPVLRGVASTSREVRPHHWRAAQYRLDLARCLQALGAIDEAERQRSLGAAWMARAVGASRPRAQWATADLDARPDGSAPETDG